VKDEHSRAIASMNRATNQSGVFCRGSRPLRSAALVEYRAMPLAFGLDPENGIEHSRSSNRALQYTRQTFAYPTNLADRRRFIAAINELCTSGEKTTTQQIDIENGILNLE
jgi:hypothetical protein